MERMEHGHRPFRVNVVAAKQCVRPQHARAIGQALSEQIAHRPVRDAEIVPDVDATLPHGQAEGDDERRGHADAEIEKGSFERVGTGRGVGHALVSLERRYHGKCMIPRCSRVACPRRHAFRCRMSAWHRAPHILLRPARSQRVSDDRHVLLRAVAALACRVFVSPEVGSVDRAHCLICGDEGVHWLGAIDRELRRCRNCRFTWIVQGVETRPNGTSIYETGDSIVLDPAQADYYRDETAVDAAREKLAWIRRYARSGGRLLDVGANLGFFVREAAREFRATGIEPGAAVVEFARREHGVDLQAGSVYGVADHLTGQFDIVTLFDVLEHLADPGLAA